MKNRAAVKLLTWLPSQVKAARQYGPLLCIEICRGRLHQFLGQGMARQNITVNAICPNSVDPDVGLFIQGFPPPRTQVRWNLTRPASTASIPQGREQTVEDMGALALYLPPMTMSPARLSMWMVATPCDEAQPGTYVVEQIIEKCPVPCHWGQYHTIRNQFYCMWGKIKLYISL